jgi:LytR cell envelope-related transcriptional attenuator
VQQLRGIRPADVVFRTVPLSNTNYSTPTGESAVRWNDARAKDLFQHLGDLPPPRHRTHHGLSRSAVRIDVYNGSNIAKLSARTGSQLAALGFHVLKSGVNWRSKEPGTLIEYPTGQRATAKLVLKVLPGAHLQAAPNAPAIQVVLGSTGHQISSKAHPTVHKARSVEPGETAVNGQRRTAAQDACH